MAYNSRYALGYGKDEVPINSHDFSDDEEDLSMAGIQETAPIRSGMSPFGDTAYQGYQFGEDAEYEEPLGYEKARTTPDLFELQNQSSLRHDRTGRSHSPFPNTEYGFLSKDPHQVLTTPLSINVEDDPEAGFRERQQPLKRGHTRKVKLVNGDIFCTDYP